MLVSPPPPFALEDEDVTWEDALDGVDVANDPLPDPKLLVSAERLKEICPQDSSRQCVMSTPQGGNKTLKKNTKTGATQCRRRKGGVNNRPSREAAVRIDELTVHSIVIGSEDSNETEHLRFENAIALL